MNIWIDIAHTPQFNYYRNFIVQLSKLNHQVYVTILNRGRLSRIVQHELMGKANVFVTIIGRHRMTKWSAIMDANILRIPKLWFWSLNKHIDVAFSNHHQTSIVARLLRIPSYSFDDDPQAPVYPMMVKFATANYTLVYEDIKGNTTLQNDHLLKVLKEWAYLNPRTFVPNPKVLDKYGVQPKQYIFLREVSVGTVNYAGQAAGAIRDVASVIANAQCTMHNGEKMKVLFSLEEKNHRSEYPADWILLQEPIEDIHSLIYYSAGLVSSGDSMAREAALLGVPAYYLGIRYSMPANLAASKVANLQNTVTMPFEQWITNVCDSAKSVEERINDQNILRDKIDHEFIDINAYMLSLVDKVAQEKKND